MGRVSKYIDYIHRFRHFFKGGKNFYTEYFLTCILGVYKVDLMKTFGKEPLTYIIGRPLLIWRYANNCHYLGTFQHFKGIIIMWMM